MNPFVAKILGEDSSVVPVPGGAASRRTLRSKARTEPEDEDRRKRRHSLVSSVLGMTMEAEEQAIFPDNAEDLEVQGGARSIAGMKAIRDFTTEPTDPYSEGEKSYSPTTALVAPDVTPNATKPLDPSQMPGVKYNTFASADAVAAPPAAPVPPPAPETGNPPNAMEILLGRNRPSSASHQPFQPTAPVTAEAAALIMGVAHMAGMAASGEALMEAGKEQAPPPPRTDIKGVCDVARRFM